MMFARTSGLGLIPDIDYYTVNRALSGPEDLPSMPGGEYGPEAPPESTVDAEGRTIVPPLPPKPPIPWLWLGAGVVAGAILVGGIAYAARG